MTRNIQLFGRVQNLLNPHCCSASTCFDSGYNNSTPAGLDLLTFNDPMTFLPGALRAVYAGVKVMTF